MIFFRYCISEFVDIFLILDECALMHFLYFVTKNLQMNSKAVICQNEDIFLNYKCLFKHLQKSNQVLVEKKSQFVIQIQPK